MIQDARGKSGLGEVPQPGYLIGVPEHDHLVTNVEPAVGRQKTLRKVLAKPGQWLNFPETHRGHGDDRHVKGFLLKGFLPRPPLDGHIADGPNDCQHNEIGDRTQETGDKNARRSMTSPGEVDLIAGNRSYRKLGRTRVFGQFFT